MTVTFSTASAPGQAARDPKANETSMPLALSALSDGKRTHILEVQVVSARNLPRFSIWKYFTRSRTMTSHDTT